MLKQLAKHKCFQKESFCTKCMVNEYHSTMLKQLVKHKCFQKESFCTKCMVNEYHFDNVKATS